MENKWENLGDIDFLTYGGCLVKPAYDDPELAASYNVFYMNVDTDEEDKVFATLLIVDVDDYINDEKNKMDILKAIGLEDRENDDPLMIMDNAAWAKEIIEYYGVSNFSPTVLKPNTYYPTYYEDYLCTPDEVKDWLIELGAGDIIKRDPDKMGACAKAPLDYDIDNCPYQKKGCKNQCRCSKVQDQEINN